MLDSTTKTILALILAPVAIYIAIFSVTRRRVALRFSHIGKLLVALTIVTTVILRLSNLDNKSPDLDPYILLTICLVSGLLLWPIRNIQLLRLSHTQYLDMIYSYSQNLFLPIKQEPNGSLSLADKTRSPTLHITPLSNRLLFVRLPSAKYKDKITLLMKCLNKSLPGPIPHIRCKLD